MQLDNAMRARSLIFDGVETKCYFRICGAVPRVQFEDSVLETLLKSINLGVG